MPCFPGCFGNFVKKSPAKPVNILLQVIHVSVYRFRLRHLKHLPAKIQPGTHIFLADRGTGDDAAPLRMPGNPVLYGLLITLQKGFLGRVELVADDGQFPHDVVNARIRHCPSAEKTDSAPLQHTHGPRLQCGEAAQVFRVADTLAAKRGQVFGRKLRAAQVKRNQLLSGCPDMDIEIDHKQVVKNCDVCHGTSSRDSGVMRGQIVSLADFAHKPVLQLQQGIVVFALGKREMLYGSRRSGSAPANGHTAFHCHAQPELAA